ncbi:protein TRIGALACTOSYLDIACYLGLYCEROL 4, chloroplastic [Impatiens glandulifera]|uniref:protein TRIGALACTOSYLDIACYLGLYCEROL 4, chloroplastic n=1 Tax=Impatiens glandulifera TaxID=253017 RepID=UPI001FB08471|nr:protein TRIGALACTOSYLDIACYLGLYCEROL 4, chloroplastic [Impatiens glandulifera]
MKKLRWTMDGSEFWELDVSTPVTFNGVARPTPFPGEQLPLGLSRGTRLSRPKQVDFFQRFMAMPFVPSYTPNLGGLSLQRALTLPSTSDFWFAALVGQFKFHNFISAFKQNRLVQTSETSWFQNTIRCLGEKSLYALNFFSEFSITPEDTLLVSIEGDVDKQISRKKVLLHHKFPHHDLTVEAAGPELHVDHLGRYWDVPLSMAFDLASVDNEDGLSYHLCVSNNMGQVKPHIDGQEASGVPTCLLPGLTVKSAFSFKRNIDIWRSKARKLKMVQPFDIFLSNPHISASGMVGAISTACIGKNLVVSQVQEDNPFHLRYHGQGVSSSIVADTFATLSYDMQFGNFQKLFMDLTRVNARFDFPSGMKFISGSASLARDLYYNGLKSQSNIEAVHMVLPKTTVSLQQQIVGPFSFRVDSGVTLDLENKNRYARFKDPVFAIEYALQVLGSAKAMAWYSPKQKEFMIELRFYET